MQSDNRFPLAKRIVNAITGELGCKNEEVRNIWLEKSLRKIPAGESILDAGAGWLRNKPLCSHLSYVSQDLCEYDGKGDGKALQNLNWDTSKIDIISDITAIPAEDEHFDNVLCSEVFEHVPDPVAALRELVRVTKSGGRILLTAPFMMPSHQTPFYFTSGLSRYWYEHHLREFSCEIVELTPNGDFYSSLSQEVRRFPYAFYSLNNRRMGWVSMLVSAAMLTVIRSAERRSLSSVEIANHGYFVSAIKKTSKKGVK